MSCSARNVLAMIDDALETHQRHPTLFAAQLRADRSCLSLARAVERYKNEKPSPHPRPDRDEVERIDQRLEELMARDREEHDRGRRLRLNREERERRMKLTGLQLVREVIEEAGTISTVPAGSVEPSRGGAQTGGVPHQQRLDDDPRWELAETIIKRQALTLRELIDEARGLSHSAAIATLSGEEKDKAIKDEGSGRTAEELFIALGPEYGSISHIRRKRREWDFDNRGRPKVDV